MNKKLYKLLFIFLGFIILNPSVYANGVSVSSASKAFTKGSGTSIYVTVSSDSPIVSIEGSLSCSGAGVSSGLDLRFDDSSNSVYQKSYSLSIKPSSTGTVTCTTSGVRMTNMSSGDWIGLGNGSVSVTVNAPAKVTPKTYSSNNYLKSLSIENSSIEFNKDTLEYNIEVENDVSTVKISAVAEDNTATVSGVGDVNVSEGANKIEVVVTAENGNKRTYVINVTVKELKPINVKVGGKEYTIVRKEGQIDPPCEYYEKTTVKIDNEDVLAYTNKKINYTLVALKDSKGKINYYIYKDNKYTLYNEYNFGNVILYIIDDKNKIPKNYIKSSFKYNDDKIDAYRLNSDSDYYIFYAMNVSDGVKGLYMYDSKEKTVQRYNDEISALYKDEANKYKDYLIIISAVFSAILLVIILSLIVNSNSKKKKDKKVVSSKQKDPRNIIKEEEEGDALVEDIIKKDSNKKKKKNI